MAKTKPRIGIFSFGFTKTALLRLANMQPPRNARGLDLPFGKALHFRCI